MVCRGYPAVNLSSPYDTVFLNLDGNFVYKNASVLQTTSTAFSKVSLSQSQKFLFGSTHSTAKEYILYVLQTTSTAFSKVSLSPFKKVSLWSYAFYSERIDSQKSLFTVALYGRHTSLLSLV